MMEKKDWQEFFFSYGKYDYSRHLGSGWRYFR